MAVAFVGPEGRGGGGGGGKGGFPRLAIDVAPSAPTGAGGTRPPSAGHPHGANHGMDQQHAYHSIEQFSQKVELYSGSVATVFQAVETATGNRVVIKAYHKAKMQPKHVYKLEREIAAMAAMNGSFVVELYSTFSDPECVYLVMEFCEGGDLFKTMLKHGGRLDEHYVCVEIVTPLLRVLEKMHALKHMHRDIKPENIFLTRRGRLRLGDFGLAMSWERELPFSRSGTLDYMAPEVLQNPSTQLQESPSVELPTLEAKKIKPFSCAVDVWAAGVLAYELVCGRPPFEVEDEVKTVTHILYKNDIHFPPHYSSQWSDFVRCALIKDPRVRPDATALLTHPWITNNLRLAIERAPSDLHRRAKQELLRPLGLAARPMRVPSTKGTPTTPPAAPGHGHGHSGVNMPMTPQPMRAAAAPDVGRQMHYLHQHFSGMNCQDEYAGTQHAEPPEALQHATSMPAPPASHVPLTVKQQQPQQLLQQQQQPATAPKALYRPSPLSRTNSTPTKSHAPPTMSAAATRLALERQSPSLPARHVQQAAPPPPYPQQQQQQQQQQQVSGGAMSDAVVAALQRKLQALHQAAANAEGMSTADMTALMASAADAAGAHGAVHIMRSAPAAPAAGALAASGTPTKTGHAYMHEATPPVTPARPSERQTPLLKRLFVPGSPATPEDGSPVGAAHLATPGPAGPGIKERLKWHLSRQAGAV